MGRSRYERERDHAVTVLSASRMRPEHKRWWGVEEHLALWPFVSLQHHDSACAASRQGGPGLVWEAADESCIDKQVRRSTGLLPDLWVERRGG